MKPFFSPEPVIFFNSPVSKKMPGNTISAMTAAFEAGADVLCLNIQLSKDKKVMAISDPVIDKLCDGTGMVGGMTHDELKSFDAGYSFSDENGGFPYRGKGLRFLALDEVFAAFPGKKFNITLMNKDRELVKEYVSLVKKHEVSGAVLTSSMYGKNIKLVRKLLPGSATSFSFAGIIGVYALFRAGILYFVNGFKADAYQTPEIIGASYLASGAIISQLHRIGIRVHVWFIKDSAQLKRVFDAGADGFMVDDVEMAASFLKEAGTRE